MVQTIQFIAGDACTIVFYRNGISGIRSSAIGIFNPYADLAASWVVIPAIKKQIGYGPVD